MPRTLLHSCKLSRRQIPSVSVSGELRLVGHTLSIPTAALDRRVRSPVAVSAIGNFARWLRGMRPYWKWLQFIKRIGEDQQSRVLTGMSRQVDTSEIIVPSPIQETFGERARGRHPGFGKLGWALESAGVMLEYRPEDVVGRIAPRAVMLVATADDTFVPPAESEGMFTKAGEPKRLLMLRGYEHPELYFGAGFVPVMRAAVEWFDWHLKARER